MGTIAEEIGRQDKRKTTDSSKTEQRMAAGKSSAVKKRRIYALKGYPPEVVAVAFAKCSRCPDPFDDIAQDLSEDKSRQFHEKWIVGYGHSSVAEHAVLSIAIENVSIIATKVIEDCRLASYTEKSTRYQAFDRESYFRPARLMQTELGKTYVEAADFLMDTYLEVQPEMERFLRNKYPQESDVPQKLHEIRIKNKVLDSCRYLLPASVMTNLGWTVNARQLEHGITKFLSHPLEEMNEIGHELRKAAMEITPTLIKYTVHNDYMAETEKTLTACAGSSLCKKRSSSSEAEKAGVELVEYDPDATDKLVCAILYRFSDRPYADIRKEINAMPEKEKAQIIDEALSRLGKYDRPLRELEHVSYTFDILVDYGAFRDIQRHRMATQTNQLLTARHGYCVPDEIVEAGLEKKYRAAMDKAALAFAKIEKELAYEAQYIVPLGFNKRVLFRWNLRDLMHFIKLRSGPTGHISYRRIAQECHKKVAEVHPMIAKYISVNMD